MTPLQALQTLLALGTFSRPQQAAIMSQRIRSALEDATTPAPQVDETELNNLREDKSNLVLKVAELTAENEKLADEVAKLKATAAKKPTTRRRRTTKSTPKTTKKATSDDKA